MNIITLFFGLLVAQGLTDGIAAFAVGLFFLLLALFSISKLKETFGKDLNYIETGEIL